jgi:hypothetical protein
MKNVILWGFDSPLVRHVMLNLEQEKQILIKKWFVCEGQRKDEFFKDRSDVFVWLELIWSKSYVCDMEYCNEKIESTLYKKIYTIMDLMARESYFTHRHIYEYQNVIHLLIYYFNGLLKHEKIDLIIFDDVPHDPPNYILCYLAKLLNIKTLMLRNASFPHKFNYIYDIEDFGVFAGVPKFVQNASPVHIPQKYEKNIYYMKKKPMKEKLEKSFRILTDFSLWFRERKKILKKNSLKYDGVIDFICKKIVQQVTRYSETREFKKNFQKLVCKQADLNQKFVYFPLHLQPELSTSVFGERYCDQLLALERLSQFIPDDWYIYVKENPRQTSYMRGKYFFERLELIPKIKLIDNANNTYDLIRNCKFVSTIRGTAGWEAISGGKNALIFALAWYRDFPGIFTYSKDLKLDDILNYKIDHNEVEEQLSCYMDKTATGIYKTEVLASVDDFDPVQNEVDLKKFFDFILAKI